MITSAAEITACASTLYPGSRAALFFVDLTRPLPDPETFLVAAELETLKQFNLIKRRKQWLGGRLAAKKAILQEKGNDQKDWEISNEKDGRPGAVFIPSPGGEPAISISHSHDLAVAAAAMVKGCGIDIEPVSPRPARLAGRFSSAAEARVLKNLPQEHAFTLLWCAKESLRKAVRPLPGFFDLDLVRVETGGNGYIMTFKLRGAKPLRRVIATVINGYGFSLFLKLS